MASINGQKAFQEYKFQKERFWRRIMRKQDYYQELAQGGVASEARLKATEAEIRDMIDFANSATEVINWMGTEEVYQEHDPEAIWMLRAKADAAERRYNTLKRYCEAMGLNPSWAGYMKESDFLFN